MRKKKDINLTIITIVKDDYSGLVNTYNSLQYLIDSQFMVQWIVVDGTSIPLDKSFMKKPYPIIIEEIDFGIYNAMNKGINLAEGKYLFFLNAGDTIIKSSKIQKIKNILKYENEDIICFSWKTRIKNKTFKKLAGYRGNKIRRVLRMPSSHQSTLYKTEKMKKNKFDEQFLICGDYAMYLNSLNKNWGYKIYKKIYLVVFMTDGISTKRPFLLAKESIIAIFKYSSINLFSKMGVSIYLFLRTYLRYFFIIFIKNIKS